MSDFGIGHNGGPMIDQQFGGGWVAIWRSMRTHPVVGFHLHATPCDPNRGALQPALAWIDLIMECRYAAGTVDNNGRVMRLERGQLLGATSWLAKRWNWTPKAVRVWLDKLENQGMISFTIENNPGPYQSQGQSEHGRLNGRSRGRFANVLTICNYNKHQNGDDPEGQVEGPIEGQANGRLTAGSGQVDGRLPYIENARAITKETKEQGKKETIVPLPPEQAAVPSAAVAEKAGDEFSILNGTTEALVRFIAKATNTTPVAARDMLRSNVQIYTGPAVNEAYALTLAKMSEGPTPNAYRYFLQTAAGIRDKKKAEAKSLNPKRQDDSDSAVLARMRETDVGRRWIAELGEAGALAKYRKHRANGGASANA